ncbi:FAD:protein FMN transferase [uncultured Adlercreutzia sp.]|uniref:FAD:protein FMN transferase n=1 Tax=uncultured Adlercreutzia sp. TaxID=875803 RepID=UPI0025FE87C5|nr:FAD:protein FMN transferase [uncultured Adlercreutzia sp.]
MTNGIDNQLDPIPSEEFCEVRAAANGKPAGVRFLAFNTVVDVEAYGEADACTAAFDEARALCRTYERLFSRTLPHSDIARLNAAAGEVVEIDPLTFDVLQAGLRYCAESEGAFDITVGPAVRLWNFHEGTVPDADELARAMSHVNWRGLKLWKDEEAESARQCPGGVSHLQEPSSREGADSLSEDETPLRGTVPPACFAQLEDPAAAVDVGGIAKGWIADALLAAMEVRGLSGIIVNLGGNVAVSGTKPDGSPWRVGIRNPQVPEQLIGAVPLTRGSAVTSGTYERCFTAPDGTFYHHILDPRTGMPADTDVAGVTVICEKSLDAEGFSTTLLALGLEHGCALVERHPEIAQAFFIDGHGTITPARR